MVLGARIRGLEVLEWQLGAVLETGDLIFMELEEIYQFFAKEPVTFLCPEQAVCYVLSVLLKKESCATELIQQLETEYPQYRLSDPVLFDAIQFLQDQGAIMTYSKKVSGRGRPRRMFQLVPQWQDEAQKLAMLWITTASKQLSQPKH